MKTRETTTPVRAFDRAYINGQFVTPHGTQIVDLVNPTDNKVIGKVTMADEIDTRKAIGAAKEAFNTFSQSSKEYRMELMQRLHDAVAKRMDQLVEATVVEYGAPQDRAKGSNNLAANIFLHFKKVLEDFDLLETVGTSKVVMEPAGVVGIFTPWNSSAGSIAIKVAPAIAAGCTVVIKPSEMSAMQTEVLMDAFHEAGLPPGVINVVTGLGEVVGTELTKSPDIQKIAFTGSTQIGKCRTSVAPTRSACHQPTLPRKGSSDLDSIKPAGGNAVGFAATCASGLSAATGEQSITGCNIAGPRSTPSPL